MESSSHEMEINPNLTFFFCLNEKKETQINLLEREKVSCLSHALDLFARILKREKGGQNSTLFFKNSGTRHHNTSYFFRQTQGVIFFSKYLGVFQGSFPKCPFSPSARCAPGHGSHYGSIRIDPTHRFPCIHIGSMIFAPFQMDAHQRSVALFSFCHNY